MTDFIQLKKDNILRIGIKNSDGMETGEYLEFDLEDIELPLKINQAEEEHKKNVAYVRNQFIIIDKKEDHKGKKLLSFNQEEKIKVMKEYYKREMHALDLFIGDGGTLKLLNGRKPYYTMYEDINEILQPILPLIQQRTGNITEKIKKKYSTGAGKENVLE